MCFGGGSSSSAAEARASRLAAEQEQAEREARIREGQVKIDEAFSQFDDGYYDDYSQSLIDYARPQLDRQYTEAQGKLIAALAGRGMLESTVGANQTSKLSGAFADELAKVQNDATNSGLQLRQNVENQKGDLYALNTASADPSGISAQAIGTATSLAAPSPATDIGRVFDSVIEPYIAFQSASRNAAPPRTRSPARVASGSGSSVIVG